MISFDSAKEHDRENGIVFFFAVIGQEYDHPTTLGIRNKIRLEEHFSMVYAK